jgi:hypothetical protein
LIERVRSKRLSDVILLKEDGSGDPYERPLKGPEDWWLQLPHAYWLEGHYKTLRLPTKIMVLIALSRPDGFPLPYDRAHDWYGVSSDSAEDAYGSCGPPGYSPWSASGSRHHGRRRARPRR